MKLDASGKIDSKTTTRYDEMGNVVERVSYDASGKIDSKTTHKHDAMGNNVESVTYDASGKNTSKSIRKYDKKGNNVDEVNYDSRGKIEHKIISKYDKMGNKVDEVWYHGDGKPDFKNTYKYDEKGNRVKWTSYMEKHGFGVTRHVPSSEWVFETTYWDDNVKAGGAGRVQAGLQAQQNVEEAKIRSIASPVGLEGWGKERGVSIVVKDYSDKERTFDVKSIENQVALKLRLAGIKLNGQKSLATIFVNCLPVHIRGTLIGYSIIIRPTRVMKFVNNGNEYTAPASGSKIYIFMSPPNYRNYLDKQIDRFLLDYLNANPN